MCQREAISPSLTAPGMEGSWWSGLKDSVRKPSGGGPTRKSTRWNPIWPMPEQWFLNSGSTLTRMSRFRERQANPTKQWKITDEDWRNREKWDQYEEAVNEMLIRTSTTYAPWIVVEGNDKRYARVKVLQTVVDALEKKIKEVKTDK